MSKDLTNSVVERKNILNNNSVIQEIYTQIGFWGVFFEGEYRYTKQQVSSFFEIDVRTIERSLKNYGVELAESGYELFTGNRLKELRNAFSNAMPGGNELISVKSPSIGVFTHKSFLNLGMLLKGSEKAKELRSAILDIVIDVLNRRRGGSTKYINQSDREFIGSAILQDNCSIFLANTLNQYVEGNKYEELTDKIFSSIFGENAMEYRVLLNDRTNDSLMSIMYSKVLDLVAIYEIAFAEHLKNEVKERGRKLNLVETNFLYNEFEEITALKYEPLRQKARVLMSSREMAFRDALHEKLKDYINEVDASDFEKFLGEKSKTLEERIVENKDVFQRLRDR